jgi:transcriptional regulator with XRE-family HTH domain
MIDTWRIILRMEGDELRRLRKRLGLTQAQLGARVGVARNTIARQERGEMGIGEPLARLIRLLATIHAKARPKKRGR